MTLEFLPALALLAASLAANTSQEASDPAKEAVEAAEQSSTKDEETAGKAMDKDVKSCRYSHVVGSRIPQRICMTQREWEDMETQHVEAMQNAKNRGSSCPDSGPC